MSAVVIDKVSISYGSNLVLNKASLTLDNGSVYCLVGPSVRFFFSVFLLQIKTCFQNKYCLTKSIKFF